MASGVFAEAFFLAARGGVRIWGHLRRRKICLIVGLERRCSLLVDLVGYATLDSYAFGECRGLVHSDRASIEPLLSWHELRFHGGAGESLEGFSWQPGNDIEIES